MMETEGTRQIGHPNNNWKDCVKENIKNLGLSREDAQDKVKQDWVSWGNQDLTIIMMIINDHHFTWKWLLKWCVVWVRSMIRLHWMRPVQTFTETTSDNTIRTNTAMLLVQRTETDSNTLHGKCTTLYWQTVRQHCWTNQQWQRKTATAKTEPSSYRTSASANQHLDTNWAQQQPPLDSCSRCSSVILSRGCA